MVRSRSKKTAIWTGVVVAPVAALLLAAILALWRPGWYRSQPTAGVDAQSVRDDLSASAQSFSDALMQTGEFEVHLRQEQVNGWVARRAEIYPMIERETPRHWQAPVIAFRDGAIRLAATYDGAGPAVVLSVDLAVTIDGDDIVLKADGCRVGAMRVPMWLVRDKLARHVEIGAGKAWRGSPEISGSLRDGLRVGTRAVWPNGERLYDVLAVTARPGELTFKIDSLGSAYRERDKRRSSQEPEDNPFVDETPAAPTLPPAAASRPAMASRPGATTGPARASDAHSE